MDNSVSRIPIRFRIGDAGTAKGELTRFSAPRTVDKIVRTLPVEGRAALWNEEVYFKIPLEIGAEKPRAEVEKGAVAYWPMGNALCIFYGSSQPYSPVSVVGHVTEGLDLFRKVKSGDKVLVEKL